LGYFTIGYEFNYLSISYLMLLGFVIFQLVSNILNVFELIQLLPISNRYQSLDFKIRQIKIQLEKIRQSYVDFDIFFFRTILVLGLIAFLFLNTFLALGFDSLSLVLFVLFMGTWIVEHNHQDTEKLYIVSNQDNSSLKLKPMLLILLFVLVISPFLIFKLTRNIDLSMLDKSAWGDSIVSSPLLLKNELSQADLLVEEGLSAYYEKNYELAEYYFIQAIQLDSQNKYAHNNLGLAYFFQNKIIEAKEQYIKAIELDEDYANSHNNIGRLYLNIEEWEKSIYHLNRAIELNPRNQTYASLGDAHVLIGNDFEALQYYKKAQELDPSNTTFDEAVRVTELRLKNR